ncbi:MAG: hypothetical protein AB7M05_08895 [Alphaproteobacteria bacterium]
MTRDISSQMIAASQAQVARPVIAAELDFSSGFVRVNSSPYTITIDGQVYLGVGALGKISAVQEGSDQQAYGMTLSLSGIPPELVSIALGEYYQGRSCRVLMALLDEGHTVVSSPIVLWSGRMDTMDIELGETATITLSAESRLVDWERPRIRRYTSEDQRADYPNDKGFEFVPQMVEKELIWGRG